MRMITVSEVFKALKELKSKKVTSVDGILSRPLKVAADAVASPLVSPFSVIRFQLNNPTKRDSGRIETRPAQVRYMYKG